MVLCRYRFGGRISLSALPHQLFPTLVENLTGFSFSVNRLVSKKCIHMSIYKTVKCWWAYILLFYCWRLFSLKVFVPVFVSGENVASTLPFDCELPADTFAQIYATRCKRQLHVLKIAATTKRRKFLLVISDAAVAVPPWLVYFDCAWWQRGSVWLWQHLSIQKYWAFLAHYVALYGVFVFVLVFFHLLLIFASFLFASEFRYRFHLCIRFVFCMHTHSHTQAHTHVCTCVWAQ